MKWKSLTLLIVCCASLCYAQAEPVDPQILSIECMVCRPPAQSSTKGMFSEDSQGSTYLIWYDGLWKCYPVTRFSDGTCILRRHKGKEKLIVFDFQEDTLTKSELQKYCPMLK